MKRALFWFAVLLVIGASTPLAEDWPDFRGKDRLGVWNETGIVDTFPPEGLPVVWRVPIKGGFSSPTVVGNRVFVMDFTEQQRLRGIERLLALDEKTGKVLWTQEWPANYARAQITMHESGPAATAIPDGNRVYALGRTGILHAVNANSGEILWSKDLIKEFNSEFGGSGATSPPLIEGNLLISVVSGEPNAGVVAWDKLTGKEVWRAGSFLGGTGPAIVVTAAGKRQLIVWHHAGVVSYDPMTGKQYWEQPFVTPMPTDSSTPVYSAPYLLVSDFIAGAMAIKLDDKKPTATLAWKSKSTDEIDTDILNSLISTLTIKDGYLYGICSYGQLRCIRLATGERVWETQAVTKERTRYVTAFIVRNGDRYFIDNDRGELIIAKLSPEGYTEISRTHLIKPTTEPGNRRQMTYVHWSHPAYANRRIYVRNDEEIICYSLAAPGK